MLKSIINKYIVEPRTIGIVNYYQGSPLPTEVHQHDEILGDF